MNSCVSLFVRKMKGFALIVLCAFVAVQARHTAVVKSIRTPAALGENPWVVKLNIAVSTSGNLEYGTGVLIDSRWILTAASVVADSRYIWVRYGAVEAISPQLVTENSIVRINPNYNAQTGENNIALININRDVHSTDYIAPIGLAAATDVTSGKLCGYGLDEAGNPGERLSCYESAIEQDGNSLVAIDAANVTPQSDVGAGLQVDDKVVAILTEAGGRLTQIGEYLSWIEEETGLDLTPDSEEDDEDDDEEEDEEDDDEEDDDEEDDEEEDVEDVFHVNFVN